MVMMLERILVMSMVMVEEMVEMMKTLIRLN